MIYNINEELNNLMETKKVIGSIAKDIEIRNIEYEKSIEQLKKELILKRNELDFIKSMKIQMKLGDLIDELSWLSGVDVEKISISIKFNHLFSSVQEMFNFFDNIRDNDVSYFVDNVRFNLSSNLRKEYTDAVSFDYFKFLLLDLGMVQCDGKKLIEHFSYEIKHLPNGELSVLFFINENINDIICDFTFGDFENRDNTSWHPADLFMQAVINCSQKKYNSKIDKIRSKVKKSTN